MTRRVILLHGIWMVGATMRWMASRLRGAGYEPEIFSYHSIVGGPAAALPKLAASLRSGPAHMVGREREYCQIERLANLGELPAPYGFRVACFPIRIAGAGAGWTRAVALIDD